MSATSHNRLDRCRRCGCPEEAHFDANGNPGRCDDGCPCECRGFRNWGLDLSDTNRLLYRLLERTPTSARVVSLQGPEGWDQSPVVYPTRPKKLEVSTVTLSAEYNGEVMERILGSVGLPPEVFRGERRSEVNHGPFHESPAGWLAASARAVVDAGIVPHGVVGDAGPWPATGPPE